MSPVQRRSNAPMSLASASMSPAEFNALQRVGNGLAKHLPDRHRAVLLAMKLVAITLGGVIVLTEAGRQRLATRR